MEAGKINCSHTTFQHLFHNVCCENQILLKKIANVVFNILTLCIPLIVYQIHSYFYERSIQIVEKMLKDKIEKINNRPIEKKYSKIGEEAIDFAKQKLLENKECFLDKKIPFLDLKFKPKNEAIAYLTKIYFHYYKELCKALKKSKNEWNDEVNKVADAYFKIGYALTSLTLDDLKLLSKDSKESYEKCLTRQSSAYMFRTFFYGLKSYRNIRGKMAYYYKGFYKKKPRSYPTIEIYNNHRGMDVAVVHFCHSQGTQKKGLLDDREHDEDHYSQKFFEEGTIQYKWRNLYNDLCDRIYQHVNKEELEKKDSRFTLYSRRDLPNNSEEFHVSCGPLPT